MGAEERPQCLLSLSLRAAPNNYSAPGAEAANEMRMPCKFMQIKQSAGEIF